MRSTRKSLTFFFAFLVTLLIALNTQVGWLYLFASIYVSIMIFEYTSSRSWLNFITVDFKHNVKISRLSKSPVKVIFKNLSILPLGPVFLDIDFANDTYTTEPIFLRPREHKEIIFDVSPNQRGIFSDTCLTISTGGAFGVFKSRKKTSFKSKVMVVPRYAVFDFLINETSKFNETSGGVESFNKFFRGPTVIGVNQYSPGALLRDIHWRSFAKKHELVLKEFETETNSSINVVIDSFSTSYDGNSSLFDLAADVCASLCYYLEKNAYDFTLSTLQPIQNKLERPSFNECLTWLSKINLSENGGPYGNTGNNGYSGNGKRSHGNKTSFFVGGKNSFKEHSLLNSFSIICHKDESLEQCLTGHFSIINK